MIPVTRLDGQTMFLNNDLIESIEPTPDTLITMSNGDKLYVREAPEVVVEHVVRFKRMVHGGSTRVAPLAQGSGAEQWR